METVAACIHCGTRANRVKHFCSRCGFARVIDPRDFAELRELDGCLCATSDGRNRESCLGRKIVSGAVLETGNGSGDAAGTPHDSGELGVELASR